MSAADVTDLRGKEFERADMTGARFTNVTFKGTTFRACELQNVRMRGVEIWDTTLDGEFQNLVINGVDVAPLVEAELDRRHPERPKFRPTTPDGFRDEALSLRLGAMATVRRVVDGLTDEQLESQTEPLVGPAWPDEGATFSVRECLLIVLNEE